MSAAIGIAWFLGMALALIAIYQTVGMHLMVNFFPEGKRWWQIPAHLASLALFAALSINHPF